MPGRRKAHENIITCKIRFICAQNGQISPFDLLGADMVVELAGSSSFRSLLTLRVRGLQRLERTWRGVGLWWWACPEHLEGGRCPDLRSTLESSGPTLLLSRELQFSAHNFYIPCQLKKEGQRMGRRRLSTRASL